MALELLLADSANLRKQLAQARCRIGTQERQLALLLSQLATVRSLARQIDEVLLAFTAKLHFKEMALVQGRQIRLDTAAFHDLIAEVHVVKEKVQRMHDALERGCTEPASPPAAETNGAGSSDESPLTSSQGTRISLAPPPQQMQRHQHQHLRKQISWDPTTTAANDYHLGASASTTSGAQVAGAEDSDNEAGDNRSDQSDAAEGSSESSQSLQDGILASASAGMIGLKTLQLFSRRSDALQGPQSRRWFNRLRCCSFQECAVVIHLVYLHLIALVAIGGITCLIVGITLEHKEYLVAGTVLVIASYGLFLNHCFYRSASIAGSQPAAQRVRIRDNASLDLEASTAETINIDLTRPPTRSILQVDLDSSQLSRAY